MRQIQVWEGDDSWPRVWSEGGVLLVHDARMGTPHEAARAFDARSLEPLGQAYAVDEVLCLGTVAEYRAEPVLVRQAREAVILADPTDGAVLHRIDAPAMDAPHLAQAIALGRVAQRPALFVLDEAEAHEVGWWALDLLTGEEMPGLGDSSRCYNMDRERLALADGHLVVPGERWYVDDFLMDEVHDGLAFVYALPGGEHLGEIAVNGHDEAVAAVVGGRPLVAASGTVYTLPGLEVVADLGCSSLVTVYDLVEWDGRAVVVFGRAEAGYVPVGERRDELVWRRLDTGAEESWRAPGRLIDAVALPDRTTVFTTTEGVFALR